MGSFANYELTPSCALMMIRPFKSGLLEFLSILKARIIKYSEYLCHLKIERTEDLIFIYLTFKL